MAQPNSEQFLQIGEWQKRTEEYQGSAVCNGKLWLFGKTFVDQPTFHWGHYAILGGASSQSFDLASAQWGDVQPFPAIGAGVENVDEVLFVHKQSAFLLLFANFGQFHPHSLHRFDEQTRVWQKVADFGDADKIESGGDNSQRNSLCAVRSNVAQAQGVYFVSRTSAAQIGVHLLEMGDDAAPQWRDLGAVRDELNPLRVQPTHAALFEGTVLILGGVHGCGFRWQPTTLFRFRIVDQASSVVQIGNGLDDEAVPRPPFAFSGPIAHAVANNGASWLHLAGSTQMGMTGSVFNGQIWALEQPEGEAPNWRKLALEVPNKGGQQASKVRIEYLHEGGELLVAAETIGIAKAKLDI